MSRWLAVIGLFAVAMSLGAGHVFARLAFTNGTNVLTGALTRAVSATLLLFLLLRLRQINLAPLHREFKATLVLGLFISGQTGLIQLAVSQLPVSVAILVFYLFPVFTGLASAALGDERFSVRLVGTLVAAFVGLTLVLGIGRLAANPLGIAAAVGAAACFSAALVLTPRLAPTMVAPLRTFYTLATSAIVFIVIVLGSNSISLPDNTHGWIGIAGLGLCYSMGITGLFLLLPLLGPTQSAMVLNLEPVFVAMIAWLALGEQLTALQILGGVVVVGAVILFQITGTRR